MQIEKPRKIIFIGSDSRLLKKWAAANITEVISSISFLDNLLPRFVPDLIVFENVRDVDIAEIRRNELLVFVPVLVAADSFESFSNLAGIAGFPRVLLCNTCVALSDAFYSELKKIFSSKKNILPARTGAIVKYAVLFINKNISKALTREMIASQLGVAEDYLSRIFKKELGISLWDYVNEFRLFTARNLLVKTGMTVSEVSRECGIADAAYFSRLYSSFYGHSPLAERH